MTVKLYILDIPPGGADMAELHEILLRHPSFRTALSLNPYVYYAKSERSARDLFALLAPIIRGPFTVNEIVPDNSGGNFPTADWFERAPPPPRGEGHQPSEEEERLLLPLDILKTSADEARKYAIALTEAEGRA